MAQVLILPPKDPERLASVSQNDGWNNWYAYVRHAGITSIPGVGGAIGGVPLAITDEQVSIIEELGLDEYLVGLGEGGGLDDAGVANLFGDDESDTYAAAANIFVKSLVVREIALLEGDDPVPEGADPGTLYLRTEVG